MLFDSTHLPYSTRQQQWRDGFVDSADVHHPTTTIRRQRNAIDSGRVLPRSTENHCVPHNIIRTCIQRTTGINPDWCAARILNGRFISLFQSTCMHQMRRNETAAEISAASGVRRPADGPRTLHRWRTRRAFVFSGRDNILPVISQVDTVSNLCPLRQRVGNILTESWRLTGISSNLLFVYFKTLPRCSSEWFYGPRDKNR